MLRHASAARHGDTGVAKNHCRDDLALSHCQVFQLECIDDVGVDVECPRGLGLRKEESTLGFDMAGASVSSGVAAK